MQHEPMGDIRYKTELSNVETCQLLILAPGTPTEVIVRIDEDGFLRLTANRAVLTAKQLAPNMLRLTEEPRTTSNAPTYDTI